MALSDGRYLAKNEGERPSSADGKPSEAFWRMLYREHGPFLLRTAERLVGRGGQAEEIVQDTFLVAYKRADVLPEDPGALRGWLYRTTRNQVLHHRRSIARFLGFRERYEVDDFSLPDGAPAVDEQIQERQNVSLVRECVQSLPFKMREVFVLYEMEGNSGTEIAELLDIPENTVRSRLRHARAKFQAAVKKRARKQEESP